MSDNKTVVPVLQTAQAKAHDETDELVYIPLSIKSLVDDMFPLSGYDNPSDFQREFLSDGVTLAAKYLCQSSINRWESAINKAIRLPKFGGMDIKQVGIELCKRTEFRHMFELAQKAKALRAKL